MKVCVIYGSPRKNGNTATLLKPFLEELTKAGAWVAFHDVYESDIAGCRVCLECQKDKSRPYCAIEDDMQTILTSAAKADLIVLAAPVYCFGLPGPVKTVLDRLVYPFCKYYGDDPHGPALLRGKRLVFVTTCGYPVDKGADLCDESLRRLAKHMQIDYAGMLAERHRNLKEPFMDEAKEAHARAFAKSLLFLPR